MTVTRTARADIAAAAKDAPARAVWASVIAVGVALLTVIHLGAGSNGLAWSVVQVALVFVAWFDVQTRRILNRVVVPVTILALLLRVAFERDHLLECAVAGVGATAVFLLISMLARGGIGMGDVKLAGTICVLLGFAGVTALAVGTVLGGLAALIMLVRGATRRSSLAYGPYLAVGAVVVILLTTPPPLV